MTRWLILFLFDATPVWAQAPPAFYEATRVALYDVLYVRVEPIATAPEIGRLPPVARGVEIRLSSDFVVSHCLQA